MITFTHSHKKIFVADRSRFLSLLKSHDFMSLTIFHDFSYARLLKKSNSKKFEMLSCFSQDGRQHNTEITKPYS